MTKILDDSFGNWLAGFIDGEGCFYFHKRIVQFPTPQFQLKLRDDDREILEQCAALTGIGSIVTIPRSDKSKSQIKWLIIKKNDCMKLIEILDKFPLRAKKKRDYLIWREAVILWLKQRKIAKHGGGTEKYKDSHRFEELRQTLKNIRSYPGEKSKC